MHSFFGKDFLTMKGVQRPDIELVFEVTREMEKILQARTRKNILNDKILGLMFFQVSTRTRISFESAMQRLGGGVVGFADPKTVRAGDYYSESLHDTVRMMESYADVLVIRHPNEGAPADAANITDVPVINAGDGYNEHPTQCLLDLYTILRERGSLENLRVGLVGDMNIRAKHSLSLGLAQYRSKVYFISHHDQSMPQNWLDEYQKVGLHYEVAASIEDVINELDVIYMGVTHHPDFHIGRSESTTERLKTPDKYVLDRKKLDQAKSDLIVLHPLPRTDETPKEIDTHPATRFFIQAYYGVAIRMALLALIFGRAP